jgi:hypothetical protein
LPKHYVHIGLVAEWAGGEAKQMEPTKGDGWQWYPLTDLPSPLFKYAEMSVHAFLTGKVYQDQKP